MSEDYNPAAYIFERIRGYETAYYNLSKKENKRDAEIQLLHFLKTQNIHIMFFAYNIIDKIERLVYNVNGLEKDDIFIECEQGNLENVIFLINHGIVDVFHKNIKDEFPIHAAAQHGQLRIVKYFIETKKVDMNILGEFEKTPLHYASWYGHLPIVEYLVSNGADINAMDLVGRTPLFFAAMHDHDDIVSYLVSNGADKNITNNYGKRPYDVAKSYSAKNLLI